MRRTVFFILYAVACLFLAGPRPVFGADARDDLEEILVPYEDGHAAIGVAVFSISQKKPVFLHNERTPLNPASTMKIVTSVASLKHLSGAYRYSTLVSTDQTVMDGVKNLYLKGKGDPSLNESRLDGIARKLKSLGISRVSGDIVIDKSHFLPDPQLGPGLRMMTNAALVMNPGYPGNTLSQQGGDIGFPDFSAADSSRQLLAFRQSASPDLLDPRFKPAARPQPKAPVKNNRALNAKPLKPKIKTNDPVLYAGEALKLALVQNGVTVGGQVRQGADNGFVALFEDRSEPLAAILREVNKKSNNFVAEMVLKTLSAEQMGAPGSMQKGALFLDSFLSYNGVPRDEFRVFNGSGLSRDNRLSANALARLMVKAYVDPVIHADFTQSLSVWGVDGTLRRRPKSPDLAGNVIGKTGTLRDTCALTGYMKTAKGRTLAFALLVNNPQGAGSRYHALQEQFLMKLYDEF